MDVLKFRVGLGVFASDNAVGQFLRVSLLLECDRAVCACLWSLLFTIKLSCAFCTNPKDDANGVVVALIRKKPSVVDLSHEQLPTLCSTTVLTLITPLLPSIIATSPFSNLWVNIRECSSHLLHRLHVIFCVEPRKAEIAELGVPLLCHEDVERLHVAVENAVRVEGSQAHRNLQRQVESSFPANIKARLSGQKVSKYGGHLHHKCLDLSPPPLCLSSRRYRLHGVIQGSSCTILHHHHKLR